MTLCEGCAGHLPTDSGSAIEHMLADIKKVNPNSVTFSRSRRIDEEELITTLAQVARSKTKIMKVAKGRLNPKWDWAAWFQAWVSAPDEDGNDLSLDLVRVDFIRGRGTYAAHTRRSKKTQIIASYKLNRDDILTFAMERRLKGKSPEPIYYWVRL